MGRQKHPPYYVLNKSAAWNLITAFPRRDASAETEPEETQAPSPRGHLIAVKNIGPVCALSVSIRRIDFHRPEHAAQQLLHVATWHHWLSEGCRPANGLIGCVVSFVKNKLSRGVFVSLSGMSSVVIGRASETKRVNRFTFRPKA